MISLLIVEDHPVYLSGLVNGIQKTLPNIDVTSCKNGEDALRIFSSRTVDIILLDINLPDINGVKLMDRIQTLAAGIKIIFISMHQDLILVKHALDSGAWGFISKDADDEEIAAAILKVNNGEIALGTSIAELLEESEDQKISNAENVLSLKPIEKRILSMIANGTSTVDISKSLNLSPRTIENYRNRMCSKLGLSGVGALSKFALEKGLILNV